MFKTFLIHHLYLYAHAFDAADIVLDINAIARDDRTQRDKEDELYRLAGMNIDLSDAREQFTTADINVDDRGEFIDDIEQWMKRIIASGCSAEGAAFAQRLKDQALEELSRFLFFTAGFKTYHLSLISKENAREEDQAMRLSQDLSLAQAELTEARQQIERLITRLEESECEVRYARERVNAVLGSWSWRLTRSLRFVRKLFARMFV